jgi:Cft2 family RNA processing exonuclease
MRPVKRPGRARSWLNPSWPTGLLLDSYRDKLAAELASDRVLRAHTRARLDVPTLSPADAAAIVRNAESITSRGAAGDDFLSGEPADRLVLVTPELLAAALLAPDDEVAAAGAMLLHALPATADHGTQEPGEPGGAGDITDSADEKGGHSDKGRPDHSDSSGDLRRLRQQSKASAAEARQLRAELTDARADADGLRADVDRLRRERDAARAAVPSRRQRRQLANAARLASDLREARKRLGDVHARHQAASRGHQAELRELRSALENAEAERDKAIDARHRLERQLGDLPGRAYYLQNLLTGRIAALEEDASKMQRNQARSRIEREIGQFRGLSEHIAEVLPARSDPGPAVCQSGHDAAGSGTAPAGHGHGQPAFAPPAEAAIYKPVAHAGPDRGLRVEVLGGGNEIGGSAILVEAGGTRILVDAGVRPNADSPRAAAPPLIARAMEGRLDGIVVTHGHNDHAGFIPKLIDSQPKAATVCTPATAALLPTMWNDARRVMARQADEAAEYGWLTPLYGEPEIEAAEKRLHPLLYGRPHAIKDLTIQLFDAGHILGAAGVVISAGGERVVVTGDIFNLPQMSVGRAQLPPKLAREADLLVIESTYCHSPHRDRASQVGDFVSAVEEVVSGGGRVLIPAFGLGRAQEVALMMRSHLPDVRVLVDGLARQVSMVYEREAGLEIFGGRVQQVRNERHRHRLMQSFHSGVVITTSGMLSGGFAVPWAQEILPDPHSALFICGYQDEESPGRSLQRLARRDDPAAPASLQLPAETGMTTVTVAARVETYSLSAHADRNGLLDIIGELSPVQTMLVHGIGREQKEFREVLERARGHRTVRNDTPWKALP